MGFNTHGTHTYPHPYIMEPTPKWVGMGFCWVWVRVWAEWPMGYPRQALIRSGLFAQKQRISCINISFCSCKACGTVLYVTSYNFTTVTGSWAWVMPWCLTTPKCMCVLWSSHSPKCESERDICWPLLCVLCLSDPLPSPSYQTRWRGLPFITFLISENLVYLWFDKIHIQSPQHPM